MMCHKTQNQLDAFIDGTLDVTHGEAIKRHLVVCDRCRIQLQRQQSLEDRLRAAFQDERMPEVLWMRIQANLEHMELTKTMVPAPRHWGDWLWPSVVAAIVVLALGVVLLKSSVTPVSAQAQLLTVPVQNMHTFVASQRPLDVSSAKSQYVRQWFQEKVDFALPRLPVQAKGAQLVGGRLCHFLDRRVVAYVYDANGHTLSLYIMSRQGLALPRGKPLALEPLQATVHEFRGYTHILWSQIDLMYSLVSDLPQDQLVDVAKTLVLTGKSNPPYSSL